MKALLRAPSHNQPTSSLRTTVRKPLSAVKCAGPELLTESRHTSRALSSKGISRAARFSSLAALRVGMTEVLPLARSFSADGKEPPTPVQQQEESRQRRSRTVMYWVARQTKQHAWVCAAVDQQCMWVDGCQVVGLLCLLPFMCGNSRTLSVCQQHAAHRLVSGVLGQPTATAREASLLVGDHHEQWPSSQQAYLQGPRAG